jgi:hypothetical protein
MARKIHNYTAKIQAQALDHALTWIDIKERATGIEPA